MNLMLYSENDTTTANVTATSSENDFTKPDIYASKLKELNDKMPLILDDFKQAYVYYNMTPSYGDYQTNFLNIRNNVLQTNAELFMETNNIQKDIETINKDLIKINKDIEKNKVTNKKLKVQLQDVDNREDSSKQMIDDYKEMYNLQYLSNFNTLFGIVVGIYLCRKIFQ